MLEQTNVKTLEKVVVRFSGDSGDGMQLAGNIFTNVSAGIGQSGCPHFRTIRLRYALRRAALAVSLL